MFGVSEWVCQKESNRQIQNPVPFNFARCDPIDALINSTVHAFAKTSPGQIVALAEAVSEHGQPMPGYCCMDTPDVSGVWGEPYGK